MTATTAATATVRHEFWVEGVPHPKGSWKILHAKSRARPFLVADNSENAIAWQQAIVVSARAARCPRILQGPVRIDIWFYMPRPATAKSERNAIYRSKKPDVDKLCRLVLDALTGVAFTDDNQVAELHATKFYEGRHTPPGARIHTQALQAHEAPLLP